jgi:phosphoglucomutase
VVPPHDNAIIARVEATQPDRIKTMDFDQAVEQGLIEWLGEEIDEAFLDAVLKQRINPEVVAGAGQKLKIVFTGIHGTGGTMVPQALRRWGFADVHLTPSQAEPDGTFPTVKSANPEESAAFVESLKVAKEIGADLVLATDPDCDRVGIAVRDAQGEYKLMSGNEIGSLLTYYVINERKVKGKLPVNPAVVKTIVTTDLVSIICRQFSVTLDNTLTGFKWIGAKIDEYEKQSTPDNPGMNYVFGFEESYGYLAGTHARDKDAVVASCLIAEMAAWAMAQKKTLLDLLDDVMSIFGLFADSQISIYRRGYNGQAEIAQLMDSLRKEPPLKFLDEEVHTVIDVLHDKINERYSGEFIGPTNLPKSNVMVFQTSCGTQVVARPSGTEPKVKFYFSNSDLKQLPIADREEFKRRKAALAERHEELRKEFSELVESVWSAK